MLQWRYIKNAMPLCTLGWLYLVQGIPYGLQDKFIPIQLRSLGLQYSSVSLMKVLLVPWVAKGLWAPVVEVWGGRYLWLLTSLLALGISAYTGSFINPENTMSIGCMLLALNVFSAVQDITVDGLALQILPDDQLGLGNTVQVVLYKIGCLVGGAGLTFLLALTSWPVTFVTLALVYFFTAVWASRLSIKSNLSVVCPEPELESDGDTRNITSDETPLYNVEEDARKITATEGFLQPQFDSQWKQIFSILKKVVHTPGTLWLSTYVFLYKMGERGAINNMPLFILDMGLSKQSLAFWNGTICQGLSILGSFYGGIVLAKARTSIKTVLITYSSFRLFIVMFQCFVVFLFQQLSLGNENVIIVHSLGILSLCLLSYSSGVISTASFTLMMRVSRECSEEARASHYSTLASIEVAGKLLFATLAGFIIDRTGMLRTFALFTCLSALPLLVLITMPDKLCRLKKD
ncbi:major facilitator superfamily domain-containing protein 3-like [Panulirus ornatus]|uniref:major facilitator superfamily domain-containing protein 3-like n=1 Tax=Panulirus ornatus TaxID=150431 RepID=UPI003A8B8290